jgi:hypothetical protein
VNKPFVQPHQPIRVVHEPKVGEDEVDRVHHLRHDVRRGHHQKLRRGVDVTDVARDLDDWKERPRHVRERLEHLQRPPVLRVLHPFNHKLEQLPKQRHQAYEQQARDSD